MVFSLRSQKLSGRDDISKMMGTIPLDANTVALIVVTLIPLAIFAAALMMAIALLARSFKEGQSYLTPLALVVIFPALLGGLPGLEMTPVLALIPIFNASQIIRGILVGEFSTLNFAITLGANLAYAIAAFLFASRSFESEKVLFRS
jgi:sodium transport system permease protein